MGAPTSASSTVSSPHSAIPERAPCWLRLCSPGAAHRLHQARMVGGRDDDVFVESACVGCACAHPSNSSQRNKNSFDRHSRRIWSELLARLLQRFRYLIAQRDVSALAPWLADAHASGLPAFITLARGLETDHAAVEAALTLPWSTGPVEGHIHRVKLLKRRGYGRFTLDLLRRFVTACEHQGSRAESRAACQRTGRRVAA